MLWNKPIDSFSTRTTDFFVILSLVRTVFSLILLLFLSVLLGGCVPTSTLDEPASLPVTESGGTPPSNQSGAGTEFTDTAFTPFTAHFEIVTNGTKRIFTQAMYHNQSSNVYIENPDPSTVRVQASGITWDDFFKTLPFSLTADCLITGTKQTFCSNDTHKLRFLINGTETPDALGQEIKSNDFLKVEYGRYTTAD